ncbi:cysteine hydrolase family protein [Mucilaginibacter rubeus]|uniref:Cysteine hydrolase n=1 Tax=Mucilaginibacter rubeus TaxID=2027860 RepID=A0A5C1I6V9_9SPHI|nr:isochorismatase family cysteine hydrolase [Mucilaginibacter rubeus]QEM13536.1 cysteine hydrolase [Mucilaginibacter rubeus]
MEQNTINTALLVMDMQVGIIGAIPDAQSLIANLKKTIATARSKNIPVIYVVVGFRPGAPEVSSRNKGFSAAKQRFAGADMNQFMQVIPELAPADGELIVIKRRVSAFAGSDLEVVLRSFNINHLVLTGIATSGVVLSTVREASDKDYELTIVTDCCADTDNEVHELLITKIFPRQAEVVTVGNWAK